MIAPKIGPSPAIFRNWIRKIFQPGSGLSISTEGLKAKEVAPPTLIDVFLNIVPINPIEALSKGNMLQIIFFALLFGFGLSVIGDKGKQVLVNVLNQWTYHARLKGCPSQRSSSGKSTAAPQIAPLCSSASA